jgi:hypothetical protein
LPDNLLKLLLAQAVYDDALVAAGTPLCVELGMPQTISCEQLPLAKILLHAAKHPASAINGVLLGSVKQGGEEVIITDAVPLLHTSLHLAAPLEVALAQVSCTGTDTWVYSCIPHQPLHCKTTLQVVAASKQSQGSSKEVVGYYQADARYGAGDLTPVGRKIADKIASHQPSAVVLVLDNKKLSAFLGGEETVQHPFEPFTRDGSRGWKREQQNTITLQQGTWRAFFTDIMTALKNRVHMSLWDFDDHLDDLSKDPFNPHLATIGKMPLPGQQR